MAHKEVHVMSTVMTTIKKWQDEYMSMLARVEEPVVKYAEKAADYVADYVPERPHWAFLKEVPTMTELVDNQLKFRKRIVDEQAAFVRKMMKAMTPDHKVQPVTPVAKRVTRKAPVRRITPKAA
jgi:hypothetical protein